MFRMGNGQPQTFKGLFKGEVFQKDRVIVAHQTTANNRKSGTVNGELSQPQCAFGCETEADLGGHALIFLLLSVKSHFPMAHG